MLNLYTIPAMVHFFGTWTELTYSLRTSATAKSATGFEDVTWAVDYVGEKRKAAVTLTYRKPGAEPTVKVTAGGVAAKIGVGYDNRVYAFVLVDGAEGKERVRVYSDDLLDMGESSLGKADMPSGLPSWVHALRDINEAPNLLTEAQKLWRQVSERMTAHTAPQMDAAARALAKVYYTSSLYTPADAEGMMMLFGVIATKVDPVMGRHVNDYNSMSDSVSNYVDRMYGHREDLGPTGTAEHLIPESERQSEHEILQPSELAADATYVTWDFGPTVTSTQPSWSMVGASVTGQSMSKSWASYIEARQIMASKGRKLILMPAGMHPDGGKEKPSVTRKTSDDLLASSNSVSAKLMFYGVYLNETQGKAGVKLPDSVPVSEREAVLTEMIGAVQAWCAEYSAFVADKGFSSDALKERATTWRDVLYGLVRQRFSHARYNSPSKQSLSWPAANLLDRARGYDGSIAIDDLLTDDQKSAASRTKPYLAKGAFELIALKIAEYDETSQTLTVKPEILALSRTPAAFNSAIAQKLNFDLMSSGLGEEAEPPKIRLLLTAGTTTVTGAGARQGVTVRVSTTGSRALLDDLLEHLTGKSMRVIWHAFGHTSKEQTLSAFYPYVGSPGGDSYATDVKELPPHVRSSVYSYLTVQGDVPSANITVVDQTAPAKPEPTGVGVLTDPELPTVYAEAVELARNLGRKHCKADRPMASATDPVFNRVFVSNPARKERFPWPTALTEFMKAWQFGYSAESSLEAYFLVFAPDYLDPNSAMVESAKSEFRERVTKNIPIAAKVFGMASAKTAAVLKLAVDLSTGSKVFETYDAALASEYDALSAKERHLFDLLTSGYDGLDTRELGDMPDWTSKAGDVFPVSGDVDSAMEALAHRHLVDVRRVHHKIARRRRRIPELTDHGWNVFEAITFRHNGAEEGITNVGSTLVALSILAAKSPIGTRVLDGRKSGSERSESVVPLHEKYGNGKRMWVRSRPGFWSLYAERVEGNGVTRLGNVERTDREIARSLILDGVWFESAVTLDMTRPAIHASMKTADTAPPRGVAQIVKLYCEEYRVGDKKLFTVRVPSASLRFIDPPDLALVRRLGFGTDPNHGMFKIVKSYAERDKLVSYIRECLSHLDGVRVEFIKHDNINQIAASSRRQP